MNAIFYNASVYPQYRVYRRPSVIVVTGNRIEAVGHDIENHRDRFKSHKLIDLEGRVVTPGLVDSHTHFYFWAATLDTVHLDGLETFDEALAAIEKFSAAHRENVWIIGDGWSADRWRQFHLPTAEELDRVTGNRPAALFSKDQHVLWANSRALELAGIDENYPDPEGGKIERDPVTRKPTGILRELPAYFPIVKLMSRPDPYRLDKSWHKATQTAYARGVTGFHSMDGPEGWEYFSALHKKDKLGFRVHYYFPAKMLEELIEKKVISGLGDQTLQVGGVKLFADGSLGGRTALMKKPYRGKNQGSGVAVMTRDEIRRVVVGANRNRLACAVHAIGDQAVENVIAAYEASESREQLRNRIEHLQIISREDIPRLKKTGAVASMQPCHCPMDRQLVADYWGRRGRNAYIFKTLLKRGIPLAFGSDCPIEPLDPVAGIHAAVNRNGYGERGGKFYPEERITVAQALYGFTAGAAFASGRESFSGRIAPGFQADLAIFDDNIFSMPPSRLFRASIAATVFDGRLVYNDGALRI